MNEVTCPRCGQRMTAGYSRCPLCGTAIDNQSPPAFNRAQRRYVVWFVLLTLFCIVIALLLPR